MRWTHQTFTCQGIESPNRHLWSSKCHQRLVDDGALDWKVAPTPISPRDWLNNCMTLNPNAREIRILAKGAFFAAVTETLSAAVRLAFFIFALPVLPLFAQGPVTYNPGDLFLGFRAGGGTGAQQDYLVNIGPASQYQGPPGTIVTPNLGNLGADLQSVFGPSWSTRADVLWGIFGVGLPSDPNRTLYAGKAENPFGTIASRGQLRQGARSKLPRQE